MAKGKSSSKVKYTSKGERSNYSKSHMKLFRRGKTAFEKLEHARKAWKLGKNPWVTIRNPIANETNKMFVKISANDYFGDHKAYYKMQGNSD